MATSESGGAFGLVPAAWFEPVVGLWTVLLAALGTTLVLAGASELLAPLGHATWAALVIAAVVGTIAHGGFGVALAYGYRRYRGFEPRFELERFGRAEWRWLAGLGAAGLAAMGLVGIWSALLGHSDGLVAPLLGLGSPVLPSGMEGLQITLTGANEILGAAPLVGFVALYGLVLLGPAAAALFHGVLQDTLARATHPAVAVGATALTATVFLEHSAFVSMLTVHEALEAVVAFAFVLAVAVAYRRRENLVLAMAAYGLFNALAAFGGWLSLLASLHAAGHLF